MLCPKPPFFNFSLPYTLLCSIKYSLLHPSHLVTTLLAADYKNEVEVGEAFKEAFQTGLVKREELFITTKVSTVKP